MTYILTRIFAAILEEDRQKYGMPNLDKQSAAEPLEGQLHADAVAAGEELLNVATQEDNAEIAEDDEEEDAT